MKSARFVVSLSPSVNASYADIIKQRASGKSYTKRIASQELRTFKDAVPYLLYAQGLIRGTWEGVKAVGYEVDIYVRTEASDTSNRLKAYEDAVSQYLGFDDKYVYDGHFKKAIDRENPRIEGYWFTIE